MKTLFGMMMILTLTAGTVLAECSAADKKALEAWDRAWGASGQNGEKTALMDIYADDYMGLPDGTNKMTAIENSMKTFERNKANPAGANKTTHELYMITCTPMTATITHRNTVWTPNGTGGKPETYYTRSVHFLEKRNGKWQVVSDSGHGLDDYDVLGYMEQAWGDAVMTKNKDWFEQNYAADYTTVSTTGKMYNRAADIKDTMESKRVYEDSKLSDLDIRVNGDTAIVTGVIWDKGKDGDGKAFERKFRFTDTFIKRDGKWWAWASQGTLMPMTERVAKQ
jgi:ketosteroid isomerase-like protein